LYLLKGVGISQGSARPAGGEHPSGIGEHIPDDTTGRTETPWVWVAGSVTDLAAQVGAAAAAGAAAATHVNAGLVAEETRQAVAAAETCSWRDPSAPLANWSQAVAAA
jgi:thioredoxin reductase